MTKSVVVIEPGRSVGSEVIASIAQMGGHAALRHAVESVREGPDIVSLLAQCAHFERVFAGCAADLASRLYFACSLFNQQSGLATMLADSAIEVASGVFGGAAFGFGIAALAQRPISAGLERGSAVCGKRSW